MRDAKTKRDERFWAAVRDVFASRPLPQPTYCDGCKRFSRGIVCPYCKEPESSSNHSTGAKS